MLANCFPISGLKSLFTWHKTGGKNSLSRVITFKTSTYSLKCFISCIIPTK